ncbi:hemolysin family protein [Gulosibacter bifidus]|uniref:Hemolysin family protein n=1 Tax=Gulosibacter bifidus TaxID=272239 RepID=A0ABW5RH93_9MICO|nr:hemolysin family protein [Gulosibacter bifidus]
MDPLFAIPLIVALLVLAALCAAAESAIAACSRSEIQETAEDANRATVPLSRIAANPRGHQDALALAQIGAMSVIGACLALLLHQWWDAPWPALLVAGLTLLVLHILVVGSFPRSIAANRPRPALRVLARLIRGVYRALGWISELLAAVGDAFLPAGRVGVSAPASEEQLLSMVDEAAENDVLAEEDRDLIHSVFGFSDRFVREVMIPRTDMRTVDSGMGAHAALQELLEQGISRAPIIGRDSDDVRGVAYLKDLAKAVALGAASSLTVDGVARPAVFVPETLAADALLRQMQRDSTHFAMVVDEYGGVAGLVTLEDLIEELVGEISDEHDRIDSAWELLEDGTLRVAARMGVSELEDLLDSEFEHEDVDSVGGLLTMLLGRIPVLGDRASIGDYALLVDRVGRKHRVTHIRLSRTDGQAISVNDDVGLDQHSDEGARE